CGPRKASRCSCGSVSPTAFRTDGSRGCASGKRRATGWNMPETETRTRRGFQEEVRAMIVAIGEDPERQGLKRTPVRVEAALRFLPRGYHHTVAEVVGRGIFDEAHENMILVRDIELYSLCEHHMLPFFGKAHIAYIPNGKIVGLSKIARILDVYARRLQVQERLTEQIAVAICDVLNPHGVGVVIEAYHLCMMMRG